MIARSFAALALGAAALALGITPDLALADSRSPEPACAAPAAPDLEREPTTEVGPRRRLWFGA